MRLSPREQKTSSNSDNVPISVSVPPNAAPVVACPDCDAIQVLPSIRRGRLRCWRCKGTLERATGRSLDAALACAVTTLVLLFPANLLPLLSLWYGGISSETHAASGVVSLWQEGWVLVAVAVALQVVILPFFRFGLLTVSLGAVRWGLKRGWVGPAFRIAEKLDSWAMPDVFLIGCAIGYSRIEPYAPVSIGTGGWCMIAAAVMAMVTRASLDRRSIWRRIEPPALPDGQQANVTCTACHLLLAPRAAGRRCPRCGQRVWKRKPFAMDIAAALTAAGFLFYPVANIFPMSMFWSPVITTSHTIFTGVTDLIHAHLWPLACLVFTASIGIPLVKLVGMAWFLYSVRRRSNKHLVQRTELYRAINEIGRWSNIDVYTIAVFTPMVQFGQMAKFEAGIGTPAFLAVVILTMIASEAFDPRLMWDAAGAN
ncbi:MAG: paraquat-inducible protein A [Deltaproteobacteria bacterium]|nr:paraquat-inducible protein A [Deltaproteobacteria bacterium]